MQNAVIFYRFRDQPGCFFNRFTLRGAESFSGSLPLRQNISGTLFLPSISPCKSLPFLLDIVLSYLKIAENHLPADHGHVHVEILVQQDQIRLFANLDRPKPVIQPDHASRIVGRHADCIHNLCAPPVRGCCGTQRFRTAVLPAMVPSESVALPSLTWISCPIKL